MVFTRRATRGCVARNLFCVLESATRAVSALAAVLSVIIVL
jgi:hypothetical protein